MFNRAQAYEESQPGIQRLRNGFHRSLGLLTRPVVAAGSTTAGILTVNIARLFGAEGVHVRF